MRQRRANIMIPGLSVIEVLKRILCFACQIMLMVLNRGMVVFCVCSFL
jgi:hypothetical protein